MRKAWAGVFAAMIIGLTACVASPALAQRGCVPEEVALANSAHLFTDPLIRVEAVRGNSLLIMRKAVEQVFEDAGPESYWESLGATVFFVHTKAPFVVALDFDKNGCFRGKFSLPKKQYMQIMVIAIAAGMNPPEALHGQDN